MKKPSTGAGADERGGQNKQISDLKCAVRQRQHQTSLLASEARLRRLKRDHGNPQSRARRPATSRP